MKKNLNVTLISASVLAMLLVGAGTINEVHASTAPQANTTKVSQNGASADTLSALQQQIKTTYSQQWSAWNALNNAQKGSIAGGNITTDTANAADITAVLNQGLQAMQAALNNDWNGANLARDAANHAQSVTDAAKKKLATLTSQVSGTTATITNSQQVVKQLQAYQAAQVNAKIYANPDVNENNKSVINIPADFTNDLVRAKKHAAIDKLGDVAYHENHFISSAADAQIDNLDVNHLTPAVQLQLAQFAAGLINNIRQQMGNPAVTITPGAIDFANKIAQGYNADNWDLFNDGWHDIPRISLSAYDFGLLQGDNFYENLAEGFIKVTPRQSLDDIKRGIYNSIAAMMFTDGSANYGHTISIAGIGSKTTQYFGISFDKFSQDHLIFVNPAQILIPGKFDTTPLATAGVDAATISDQAQQQLKDAQAQLQKLGVTVAADNVSDQLQTAQNQLSQAMQAQNALKLQTNGVHTLQAIQANLNNLVKVWGYGLQSNQSFLTGSKKFLQDYLTIYTTAGNNAVYDEDAAQAKFTQAYDKLYAQEKQMLMYKLANK